MSTNVVLPIKVFDFFAGCGGSSQGFSNAGLDVVFALDNNQDARATFLENLQDTHYELVDIEDFGVEELQPFFDKYKGHPRLFCGCAPCQPFTKQNTVPKDASTKRTLLGEFQRFVERFLPELVFIENVPGMQRISDKDSPLGDLVNSLKSNNYQYTYQVVDSQDYGVPQKRRRLILIASLFGQIVFPEATHGPETASSGFATVKQWIGDLPSLNAGETHKNDSVHRAANLSELNMERIKALSEGQSRLEWPETLKLDCHTNGYSGHTDVYGRMWWDRPATGLTTRCTSLSSGRFGHPEQDRAISAREAALLQTFPKTYEFRGSLTSMTRQIGNAVPVLLAKGFGDHFIAHVNHHLSEVG